MWLEPKTTSKTGNLLNNSAYHAKVDNEKDEMGNSNYDEEVSTESKRVYKYDKIEIDETAELEKKTLQIPRKIKQ